MLRKLVSIGIFVIAVNLVQCDLIEKNNEWDLITCYDSKVELKYCKSCVAYRNKSNRITLSTTISFVKYNLKLFNLNCVPFSRLSKLDSSIEKGCYEELSLGDKTKCESNNWDFKCFRCYENYCNYRNSDHNCLSCNSLMNSECLENTTALNPIPCTIMSPSSLYRQFCYVKWVRD